MIRFQLTHDSHIGENVVNTLMLYTDEAVYT